MNKYKFIAFVQYIFKIWNSGKIVEDRNHLKKTRRSPNSLMSRKNNKKMALLNILWNKV